MRILILSTWWPEPADNGSRMRIMQLLRSLGARHELHLVAFAQQPAATVRRAELDRLCVSVAAVERPGRPLTIADRLQSLFVAEPASVRATWSPAFAAAAAEVEARVRPDLVIAMEVDVAPYACRLRHAPRLLEDLELSSVFEHYREYRDPRPRLRYLLTAIQHRRYVGALLRHFAAVTVVSAREAALARQLTGPRPLQVAIVPNGADVAGCAAYSYRPDPDTLIYPGALSYDANLDAARYFLTAIHPQVRQVRPQALLRITGRNTPAERAALGVAEGVAFTGYVDDIRALIARSAAEVVPLRYGGGTRLKILEALAVGTPVVSTSKGTEGLSDLQPGRHLLVADTPQAFAERTVALLGDAGLRASLSEAGRRAVAAHYDWRTIAGGFTAFVEELVMRSDHARRAA